MVYCTFVLRMQIVQLWDAWTSTSCILVYDFQSKKGICCQMCSEFFLSLLKSNTVDRWLSVYTVTAGKLQQAPASVTSHSRYDQQLHCSPISSSMPTTRPCPSSGYRSVGRSVQKYHHSYRITDSMISIAAANTDHRSSLHVPAKPCSISNNCLSFLHLSHHNRSPPLQPLQDHQSQSTEYYWFRNNSLLYIQANPLTPTVAIWVQLQSILCQTGLSRHL